MEAEVLRDTLLALSDRLDVTVGGKTLPHKSFANLNFNADSRDPQLYASHRRSVYLPVLRSALYEVFATFDFASPSTSNGRRGATMVAPQALFMMNGELMDRASRRFAERLTREAPGDEAARIGLAHEIAYGRPAETEEIDNWSGFLDRYESASGSRPSAWRGLCRVLLSSNEFLYVQ